MSTGNYFCDGKHQWDAPTLWGAAEGPGCTKLELRPKEDLLNYVEFDDFAPLRTFEDTLEYFQRVMAADLSYPIILYWDEPFDAPRDSNPDVHPIILDGFHRTMKAVITKQPTIKAIRLDRLPKPDRSAEECQVSNCGNPKRCPGCQFRRAE